jgi:hypothetical protein
MPPKKDDATADRDTQLKASREETARQTEEKFARTEKARPTPTQEENDKARLGVASLEELDNKEPDGTEEEEPARRGALNYKTRDASAARGGEGGGADNA